MVNELIIQFKNGKAEIYFDGEYHGTFKCPPILEGGGRTVIFKREAD